ncbi:hypothetical protein [Psychroserpens jangbogonensis]|uniref:hypothetical protein n=1 Tax=Psychroserpens jangbogonensis TaxID=1484460 RepID=UPI0013791D25|nr:hypothetical protein [Psychroserpens jangbogonensis]
MRQFECNFINDNDVNGLGSGHFLNKNMELLIDKNKGKLSEIQKQIGVSRDR